LQRPATMLAPRSSYHRLPAARGMKLSL